MPPVSSHLSRASRRTFLKAALAAGVAPLILPSGIWSAETKPNDRITLGFIGIGKMAHGHLPGFLGKSETQTLAVCDVDTTRRNSGKKIVEDFYAKKNDSGTYKGCDAYNDFRELIARKDIDAVIVVTPDHWHVPISIAAANAGKDIYCEKPLTQTVHESKAIIDVVRKTERVFQVGSQQRSSREFRVAVELVRNGVIGKVSRVETGFGGPGKPCDLPEEAMEPGLDWDMWLGPAPLRPYNAVLSPRGVHNHFPSWREYWEYGGGMVTDWGAHHVDIAQWGLGMDESGPVEMVPVADAQNARFGNKLRYANGVELTHIAENGVTFFGDAGQVFVNRGKIKVTVGGQEKANFMGKESPIPMAKQLDALEQEYLKDAKVRVYNSTDHKADWLQAIVSRKRPICDVEVGARTITACHVLNFGYRYGQGVKWEPKAMQFADGTGKGEWLTRDYRGPWRVA
jgi:predicted dehydrogenase